MRDVSLLSLWGKRFVTFVANLLYGGMLRDIETCYKVFRAEGKKLRWRDGIGTTLSTMLTSRVVD